MDLGYHQYLMVLNEFAHLDDEVVVIALISVKTPSGHVHYFVGKHTSEEVAAQLASART